MPAKKPKNSRNKTTATNADSPATTGNGASASAAPSREELLILAVILLVGLFLRFAYYQEAKVLPDFDHPIMDAGFKDYWARSILTGDPPQRMGVPEVDLESTPYIRPPLYPFFMATVYLMTGGSYAGIRIVQYLIGLANVVLLYLLGRSLFGRAVGLIGAAFMATYWIFIYFESELNAPALIVLLVLTFMNLIRRWSEGLTQRRAIWPGVVMGLLALIRPETLLFVPVVVAWAWLARKGDALRPLAVFVLAVVLTILPVTIRNYVRSGEFVPICTIGGLNLYAGNNPNANGSFPVLDYRELFGIGDTLSHHNFPQLLLALEKKTGQEDLGYADLERYFLRNALSYMAAHPVETAQLMVRKALLYWGPWEVTSNKVLYLDKQNSNLLRILPGFPFVAGLFVLGLIMWIVRARSRHEPDDASRARRTMARLLLLFVLVSFATHLLFFVVGRFRVPVIPILLLFGAYGVHEIYRLYLAKQWRPVVGWGAATVALVIFFHVPLTAYSYNLPMWRLQRGTAWGEKGQIDLALEELEQAVKVGGTDPWYYTELGFAYYHKGEYQTAVEWYEKALEADPHWTDALHKLGLAYMKQEEYTAALETLDRAIEENFAAVGPRLDRVVVLVELKRFEDAEAELRQLSELGANLRDISFRLGHIAASQGRTEQAMAYFEEAIAQNPESAAAYNYLGYEQARMGQLKAAEASYLKAIDLNPNYTLAFNNLGNLYAHQALYDEATIYFQSALNADPNNRFSDYGLGYVAFQQEDYDAATRHFRAAVTKHPDNAEAHNYLGVVLAKVGKEMDLAITHYRRAIELKPDFVLARNNLGDALRATGDLFEALQAFEGTLEQDPGNAYARAQAAALQSRVQQQDRRKSDRERIIMFE